MPIFEYHCKSCMREFEEVVFDDSLPVCPYCHSANTEKMMSRPCRCCASGGSSSGGASSGGGCAGCSGGSCASCGH
ncbi:MAG TPA: zinc ribbon domain-containing protein [Candidatus Mailhella excrementigallinarum]|nr:MAG: FmdB family transcriptional regulator [Desulfovibrionaceae bacterium]HIV64856.1 zinc ribbon domain-containing protein [Candidatus Mailhella excrementigallinarum]